MLEKLRGLYERERRTYERGPSFMSGHEGGMSVSAGFMSAREHRMSTGADFMSKREKFYKRKLK